MYSDHFERHLHPKQIEEEIPIPALETPVDVVKVEKVDDNDKLIELLKASGYVYSDKTCCDIFKSGPDIMVARLEQFACSSTMASYHATVKADLLGTFKGYYPKVKVFFYGARTYGLGSTSTYMDVMVAPSGKIEDKLSDDTKSNLLKLLYAKTGLWRSRIDRGSPVFCHLKTEIDCTFNFNADAVYLQNTEMLTYFMTLQRER